MRTRSLSPSENAYPDVVMEGVKKVSTYNRSGMAKVFEPREIAPTLNSIVIFTGDVEMFVA